MPRRRYPPGKPGSSLASHARPVIGLLGKQVLEVRRVCMCVVHVRVRVKIMGSQTYENVGES
jgi:hypothetical protein